MELRDKILDYLHYHPASKRADIDAFVEEQASSATVKRMLSASIDAGLVVSSGNNRATTYSITPKAHLLRTVDLDSYYAVDPDRRTVQKGYNFALIRDELPKIDIFTDEEKAQLVSAQELFAQHMKEITPGIYNRELERLGIDLSWKSAQIEGNTYTLLETETLWKELKEANGRKHEEAQMLLNHKSALKAIVERPSYFEHLSLERLEDIHGVLVEGMEVWFSACKIGIRVDCA